jgi:hypothetical protein
MRLMMGRVGLNNAFRTHSIMSIFCMATFAQLLYTLLPWPERQYIV